MELLYFFGFLMIVAKSDGAVTFTTPTTGGTAACPTLGSVAEGTQTGTVVTAAATTDVTDGSVTYKLPDGVGNNDQFTITGAVVSIKSDAVLDFETNSAEYTVIIEGDDSAAQASATCTIAVTDVQPWFSGGATTIIVPDTQTSGTVTTLACTDGATTTRTLAKTGGDDAGADEKFTFTVASGLLEKSAVALDATTKASYLLTFTCVEGDHTATTTVTICVNNESNCPSSNKASINSGLLAGLIVPALLAVYRLS